MPIELIFNFTWLDKKKISTPLLLSAPYLLVADRIGEKQVFVDALRNKFTITY